GIDKIFATLNLLDDQEELEKMLELAKGSDVKNPSQNIVLNLDYVEKNIHNFDIKEHLPIFVRENLLDNLDFLSQINDAKNIISNTRKLLQDINISVLEIPFNQQILLFGLINQLEKKDTIINFANIFRIDGL